jgi:hypothetical protein
MVNGTIGDTNCYNIAVWEIHHASEAINMKKVYQFKLSLEDGKIIRQKLQI